jgi:hypothetical protein
VVLETALRRIRYGIYQSVFGWTNFAATQLGAVASFLLAGGVAAESIELQVAGFIVEGVAEEVRSIGFGAIGSDTLLCVCLLCCIKASCSLLILPVLRAVCCRLQGMEQIEEATIELDLLMQRRQRAAQAANTKSGASSGPQNATAASAAGGEGTEGDPTSSIGIGPSGGSDSPTAQAATPAATALNGATKPSAHGSTKASAPLAASDPLAQSSGSTSGESATIFSVSNAPDEASNAATAATGAYPAFGPPSAPPNLAFPPTMPSWPSFGSVGTLSGRVTIPDGTPASSSGAAAYPETIPHQFSGIPATGAVPAHSLDYIQALVDGAAESGNDGSNFGTAAATEFSNSASSATPLRTSPTATAAVTSAAVPSCPSLLYGSWLRLDQSASSRGSAPFSSVLLSFGPGSIERVESMLSVDPSIGDSVASGATSTQSVEHQRWEGSLRVRCAWRRESVRDSSSTQQVRLLSEFLDNLAVPPSASAEITVSMEGSTLPSPLRYTFLQLRTKDKQQQQQQQQLALVERLPQADGTFEHGHAYLRAV